MMGHPRAALVVLLVAVAVASIAATPAAAATPTAANNSTGGLDFPSMPDINVNVGGNDDSGDEADESDMVIDERVTETLAFRNASYNTETEEFSIVLVSKAPQRLTLVDAGSVMAGGEVPRRTVQLGRGETTRVTMPARPVGGKAVVTIDDGDMMYAADVTVNQPLFTGDPTWADARMAGASGFLGGLIVVTGIAWRRTHGGREEVTRLV